jgi:AraC family transcriptional regulator
LAEIAIGLDEALIRKALSGASGGITGRVLAQGDGWTISDLICTCGPHDRSLEERHTDFHIAIVMAGSFQYRSAVGRELMTAGSLLLVNADHDFECSHDHGSGDRCLSFSYTPEHFARVAADAGVKCGRPEFSVVRLPALRALSSFVAQARAGLANVSVSWEELSLQMAGQAVRLARGMPESGGAGGTALGQVTRCVRMIERHPESNLSLARLAQHAGLSPFHFLRTFKRLTGVTPHQYVRRMRIREAATLLLREKAQVLDIALDCGFGDVSNFNHAFRAEFGVSPLRYRRRFR